MLSDEWSHSEYDTPGKYEVNNAYEPMGLAAEPKQGYGEKDDL